MFCIIFVFNFRWENTINSLINYFLTPVYQLKHMLHRAPLLSTALHGKSSSEPSAGAASTGAAERAGDFTKTLENEGRREHGAG